MSQESYAGEYAELIREHGYKRTAEIIDERRKAAAEPESQEDASQGDSCEMSESEWKRLVEANKSKRKAS